MPRSNVPPATMITAPDMLRQYVSDWLNEPLLAVDTESNSMHAYQGRVCLIQLSTRQHDYIIDPLAFDDMSALDDVFAAPEVEVVFHAADQDIAMLKRDFDFTFVNVFDTALAARICGIHKVGLNNLLEHEIGVRQDKNHQRDDWGERPLSDESLHYAQMDTHYLPELRDAFLRRLEREGHLEEAMESFSELCDTPPMNGQDYDPEGYWALGLPARLNRGEMRVLRQLYNLREEIARTLDVPVYMVMSNRALLDLAALRPRHWMDLEGVKALTPRQIRRYGGEILDAVKASRHAPRLPRPPRHRPPDPRVAERYAVLHQWRKERAARRGVDSDVILSKHTLWQVAKHKPATLEEMGRISGFGPWRIKTYGDEILRLLRRMP